MQLRSRFGNYAHVSRSQPRSRLGISWPRGNAGSTGGLYTCPAGRGAPAGASAHGALATVGNSASRARLGATEPAAGQAVVLDAVTNINNTKNFSHTLNLQMKRSHNTTPSARIVSPSEGHLRLSVSHPKSYRDSRSLPPLRNSGRTKQQERDRRLSALQPLLSCAAYKPPPIWTTLPCPPSQASEQRLLLQ